MSKVDLAWKKYLEHEEIVEGLLELAVSPEHGVFQKLGLRRTTIHEMLFSDDGHHGERAKAVNRERDACWQISWRQADGRSKHAILGFEVQSEIDPSMPVRVAMVNAMNYSSQAEALAEKARAEAERRARQRAKANLETGAKADPKSFLYPPLPPKPLELVVTLVIYTGKQVWNANRALRQMVDVPPPFIPDDVPSFQFRLLDLRRVPEKLLPASEKNSRCVIKYLKVHEDKEALRRLLETDEDFQEVLVDTARVIRAVTGASFRIPRKKETMNMCKAERELCEEAEKIGETRGEEKGRKKGRKEGRKEGEKRGILAYVSRLLRMNVSKEDLLDALCEDFRLSRKKAMTYLQ